MRKNKLNYMRPLEQCRRASSLSLPALERLLVNVHGGSKTTLSRLEQREIRSVNKNLVEALVEIFKKLGLQRDHIISPERYPDFCINAKWLIESSLLFLSSDEPFNEEKILINLAKQWFAISAVTACQFAEKLYQFLARDGLAEVAPDSAKKYAVWSSNITRKIRRIVKGQEKLPLSWKYHWLACFPPEVSKIALNKIIGKSGYMLVPLATHSGLKISEMGGQIDDLNGYFSHVIDEYQPVMTGTDDNSEEVRLLRLFQSKLHRLLSNVVNVLVTMQLSTGISSHRGLIEHE